MATEAKIASKSTKNTGITPAIAQKLYDKLGRSRVAIVEIKAAAHTVDVDGKKSVKLELDFIETTEDEEVEEFLREFARALYRERTPDQPLTTVAAQEPKTDDLKTKGTALYLVDKDLPDNPTDEEYLKKAAELVVTQQFGSLAMLQRKLKVGAKKATALLQQLEKAGVVAPADGSSKTCEVLITADNLQAAISAVSIS